ncbi:hypothetical protein JOB18_024204 [Solea senegalensis]|uniref:Uncharacterized protein n=1 Tax=Solea senegalensis TaxID=28829 RepID=A0AAV6SZE9_SOLSE|nr:hypothetical protein JOB18_024204 [Solea senegalensis]
MSMSELTFNVSRPLAMEVFCQKMQCFLTWYFLLARSDLQGNAGKEDTYFREFASLTASSSTSSPRTGSTEFSPVRITK